MLDQLQTNSNLFESTEFRSGSRGISDIIPQIVVVLPPITIKPCKECGSIRFKVSPGAGPHCARITCLECGYFARWASRSEGRLIAESVRVLASAIDGGMN